MTEKFVEILAIGGKSNSLGRAGEVVQIVLHDRSRLDELYACLFEKDEWLRMRAVDSLEKVCRVHPEWLLPYVERLLNEITKSTQPSIQWHLAQMFAEIPLTPAQKQKAAQWLADRLRNQNIDWIVATNAMETLGQFTREGMFGKDRFILLLKRQQKHHSAAVVKRVTKILANLE